MAMYSRLFRVPRPRTFLYLMSLRTGTELSTLALLLNKTSGLYGLLALLTGLALSPLQLSMYIYSLLALALIVYLSGHIRSQTPLECLMLAHVFVVDSVINAAYTALFGWTWFAVLSGRTTGAGRMMDEAAGFTEPEIGNVTRVEVAAGAAGGRKEALGAIGGEGASSGGLDGLHGVLQPESVSSIVVILALWAVRVYLVLVVMSYARLVLRRHVMATANRNVQLHMGGRDRGMLEDPFAAHLPEGQGLRGKIGRVLVRVGRGYWLGAEEGDEGWMNQEMGRKGSRHVIGSPGEAPGVGERERRRRSGTGPPPPVQVPLMQGQQPPQHSRLQEVRDGK